MRHNCLRLPLAFLFAVLLPLGCADSSGAPDGSGGATSGGSGGAGKGGSGGTSTAKGGSGGSASGGAAGSGGSSVGGKGGSQAGGAGGSGGAAGGGAGGQAGGGVGGQAAGGGGGTSPGDARDGGRTEAGTDAEPIPDDGGQSDVGGGEEAGGGASCGDKQPNGNETDTDCGGADCPKCGAGMKCTADADCRSGKCTAEKCADPFAADGKVAQNGNRWTITLGTVVLEVGTDQAAMITAFSLDGANFLVANNASNGSVFWTAPQSEWNWPPPDEQYSLAYTASSANNVLTLTSPVGPATKLTITKKLWGNVANQVLTIEYTIKNGNSAAVQKAPWEITRVYPGGLTFFPVAEDPVVLPGQANFKAVPFTTSDGVAWWKYKAAEFTSDVKSGADGLEGWAAHVNCGADLEQKCKTGEQSVVMIKQWADTTKQAPDEKEVELYANGGHNYVEFEQQGDYQSIPAGGTITWTMRWMLRYLPSGLSPAAGSKELADWVRSQLL